MAVYRLTMSLLVNLVLSHPLVAQRTVGCSLSDNVNDVIDVNHVNDVNVGSMTFFVYANCNDFDTLCLR